MSYLTSLGKDYNIGIWVNHHVSKPQNSEKPDRININRVRGSGAIIAQCRTILGLDKPDPQSNLSRLKMLKNNLAVFSCSWGMEITKDGTIEWSKDVPQKVEHKSQGKLEEAIEFLQQRLVDGPKPVEEVEEQLGSEGISKANLQESQAGTVKSYRQFLCQGT